MNQNILEIELNDFRNYPRLIRKFEPNINWITGSNGSGKTNLLEAVLCLSQGKSHRAIKQEDLINWECGVARVRGVVDKQDGQDELEVNIWKAGVSGKKGSGKSFKVNGVGKLLRTYMGTFSTVWFGPEDLDLIDGGSGGRRIFFNNVLSQVDGKYTRALSEYEQALKRRNKLLFLLAEGKTNRQSFYYFDEILISRGEYIHKSRQSLVEYLNNFLGNHGDFGNLQVVYDHSLMSKERLVKYQHEEVAAGVTLIGPQRDDLGVWWSFEKNIKPLRNFGSRGQQRMGALALKLGELEFIALRNNIRPVLLLDDVLSELDKEHKKIVMEVMSLQQTIVSGVTRI